MSTKQLKLFFAGFVILTIIALMLWHPGQAHDAALLDQADRDVAAARAAAAAAAQSAVKAKDAAHDLQNRLPGNS